MQRLLPNVIAAMIDHLAGGIAILEGHEFHIRYINHQFQHMLDPHSHHHSLLGLRLVDVIPGEIEAGLRRWLHQPTWPLIGTLHKEWRIESTDYGVVYWDVTLTAIDECEGGYNLILLQATDITATVHLREERDHLVRQAIQSQERLQLIQDQATDGVLVIDQTGRLSSINAAGLTMLDLDPDVMPGQAPQQSNPESRPLVDIPPLSRALHGETVQNYEFNIRRRDGEQSWLNISSAPVYDQEGTVAGAVATLQDISDRKELDQIKEDFLAVTAHELRTPVTSLLGYTNLMVRRAEHGEWTDRDLHALRMIETQVQRLTHLVNGLIDVSRVQTGSIELRCQSVDLVALARQAAAPYRTHTVDHTLIVTGPDDPVTINVWGDPQRLDQVVSHLIGNALKYSPWGGTVSIQVWADTAAHITVSDTGIGIPEEALPLLFKRFYRATNVDSDRISGLGVGLYLVKELVTAHDGQIDVRSNPEEGTTFAITLPLYAE